MTSCIHSDDGNPSRVNIKQLCGRSYALSWKPCQEDSLNLPDYSPIPTKSDSSPHAHTQAFEVNHSASRLLILNFLIIKELQIFFFHTTDDNIFNGGSIQEDTPISKESIERRETPSADVWVSNITTDDNLFNGGSIQEDTPISKERGHDMVPTTKVHVSRIFDRFRNMRLNNLGSDYMSHAAPITDKVLVPNVHKRGCLHTVSTTSSLEESIQRNTIYTQDILGHTASSSRMAPVNHAYLCMDVTNCIIRPKIITFPNTSAKNVYQSHARGDYSDTTYCRILHNEVSAINECLTLGTQKTSQSRPLQTVMYNQPSSSRNVPRRPQNQGDTTAKIDDSVNRGRGPYVFKVSGQIYHWIGSLCPEEGHHPRFLQLYIYDTQDEVANRMWNFRRHDEDTLNPEIVEGLIHILDEHNGLPGFFKDGIELEMVRGKNDLRSDYLLGLYDAVSRGDREGIQAGSKIMLPRTFTGGPRYMYSHYLDALAIFSSKRGLPTVNCYGSISSCIIQGFQLRLDKYIFSEIPDPVEDPRGYKVVTELMMHRPCGVANPGASCTENRACNKYFPKRYNENTFFDINGHTRYRRRQTEVHIMKGESSSEKLTKLIEDLIGDALWHYDAEIELLESDSFLSIQMTFIFLWMLALRQGHVERVKQFWWGNIQKQI
ncbi:hypothetical protein Tco_0695905 [Tanacetum coccineum]